MDSDSSDDFNDDFEDTDDTDTFSGLGTGAFDKPVFEEAQYKYAKSMSGSIYSKDIVAYIRTLPLTIRYKRSLISCVYTLFSEDQVLANNNPRIVSKVIALDPLEKLLIFGQRDIELTRCDATKYDLNAVNTFALEKYIHSNFRAFLTRTIGDRRERIINAETGVRSISQTEQIIKNPVEQKEKKRSFLGLGRRK